MRTAAAQGVRTIVSARRRVLRRRRPRNVVRSHGRQGRGARPHHLSGLARSFTPVDLPARSRGHTRSARATRDTLPPSRNTVSPAPGHRTRTDRGHRPGGGRRPVQVTTLSWFALAAVRPADPDLPANWRSWPILARAASRSTAHRLHAAIEQIRTTPSIRRSPPRSTISASCPRPEARDRAGTP